MASKETTDCCCPPAALPFLPKSKDYVAKGAVQLLGDLPVYITKPNRSSTTPTTAVIVSYDVYGFDAGRTREVCDHIAEETQSIVVLPDFFRGRRWTEEQERDEPDQKLGFIRSVSKPEDLLRDVTSLLLPFLRHDCNVSKIAFVGFCFGGYVAFLVSRLPGVLCCAAGVHSSIRIFNMHGSNENEAATAVWCPQMLLQASNDNRNGKPGSEVDSILSDKPFGGQCLLREFPDMIHGWVLRGDLANPLVSRDVVEAMRLVIDFVRIHLK